LNNLNIIDYLGEDTNREMEFIRGHLYIENIMAELIKKVYHDSIAALEIGKMYYKKVKLLKAIGAISSELEALLLGINQVRNKMAHQLHYRITFEECFELFVLAHKAGVDFSDDRIYQDKDYSREVYFSDAGGISELMVNTFSELAYSKDLFSEDEILELLS
jgi:hypothetical protein